MNALSRRDTIKAAAGIAGAALITGSFSARATFAAPVRAKPLVFGHRGCSALRPEHTLGSYAKAIQDGADYIEPDLVITKDGVLVARHENNIAETTDVARHPVFSGRRTTKTIDGQQQTGWFVEDFTLDELKTLRAIERLGSLRPESKSYDGQFQVLTFEEIIDFTAAESAARGRTVGLVPELKHSTFFAGIGMPLEDRFLGILGAHEYTRRAPVEIQSFEIANLRYLRRKLGRPANVRLMQLVGDDKQVAADVVAVGGKLTFGDMTTPAGLKEIATYADVVAPQIRGVIPLTPEGRLGTPRSIVTDAHKAGLLVRVWTFRPENYFLAADFKNEGGDGVRNPMGSIAEIKRYLATGIDGFFTDDPALGRAAVDS
ncbi:glycerophosphodiester phosphodiesterase [Sphingomonas paeninsulae]|uniref:glycerophosphodiester phosphodiesterase n=1 Tax=Sphingomonas paeninsulae TaxID=2319844 RepID=A0A494TKD3_SPHPE|nr:glycerophosphodiester phosphodiesterase [Sphingomonas paeninsulae]AYJ86271.1 glycerophosphodiester phosphodiesterase [Sphingomonas paeninsulae]